jgi:energy-coupling factor transporter ATP-binding protein EcfA2
MRWTAGWRSAARTSMPASARPSPDLGLDGAIADQATATLSGGQAARVSLAATLLSRFDVFLLDEPTNDLDFAGLAALEDFLVGLDAATVVVSHDRAFLERVVTHVLDLDEHTHTATSSPAGGGLPGRQGHGPPPRRGGLRHLPGQAGDLTDRARTQREWSVQGVKKAKNSGETDKFIRFKNTADSEKVAHKARATEKAMERLEKVDKPWEGWELRFEIGSAARSGDVVASLTGAVEVERGPSGSGPSTWRSAGPTGWPSSARTAPARPPCIDALLGRVELAPPASPHLGPGVVVGELSQRRDRFSPTRVAVRRGDRRHRAARQRGPVAARQVRPGCRPRERPSRCCRRASAPGPTWRCSWPRASTAWCSTSRPTTSTWSPSSSSSRRSDRFVGTVLLVTHDRAFLDRVAITRRITVAGGQVTELA